MAYAHKAHIAVLLEDTLKIVESSSLINAHKHYRITQTDTKNTTSKKETIVCSSDRRLRYTDQIMEVGRHCWSVATDTRLPLVAVDTRLPPVVQMDQQSQLADAHANQVECICHGAAFPRGYMVADSCLQCQNKVVLGGDCGTQ